MEEHKQHQHQLPFINALQSFHILCFILLLSYTGAHFLNHQLCLSNTHNVNISLNLVRVNQNCSSCIRKTAIQADFFYFLFDIYFLSICCNSKMLQLLPVKYQQPVGRKVQIPALALCKYAYYMREEEGEGENGRDRSHHLSSFNQ